jgi:large subunit ribosomal protein L1
MAEIDRLKPSAAKGIYLRTVALSLTMGPGIKIDPILVSKYLGA